MQRPQLYSEIIRSCYLGLLDDDIKPEDIKWSTFIYIRVGNVILMMQIFYNFVIVVSSPKLCT